MKTRLVLGLAVLAGMTVLSLDVASAKDKKSAQKAKGHDHDHGHGGKDHDHGHGEGGGFDMSPETMALMMPGVNHAYLDPMAGDWTYVIKFRMSAESPWIESKGKSKSTWVMGGRFLMDETSGEGMGGMPFTGMGLSGYDNMKKKYVSTWVDNMGTMILLMEGDVDASHTTFTYTGKMDDWMTGRKNVAYRTVIKVINHDKHMMEWYSAGEDGKEFKSMEINYTRK